MSVAQGTPHLPPETLNCQRSSSPSHHKILDETQVIFVQSINFIQEILPHLFSLLLFLFTKLSLISTEHMLSVPMKKERSKHVH